MPSNWYHFTLIRALEPKHSSTDIHRNISSKLSTGIMVHKWHHEIDLINILPHLACNWARPTKNRRKILGENSCPQPNTQSPGIITTCVHYSWWSAFARIPSCRFIFAVQVLWIRWHFSYHRVDSIAIGLPMWGSSDSGEQSVCMYGAVCVVFAKRIFYKHTHELTRLHWPIYIFHPTDHLSLSLRSLSATNLAYMI